MEETVDHVLRPILPWRAAAEQAITECGYDASKVKTLTRDEFFRRLNEHGQQRTAMFTCLTCMQKANRHPTWDDDPRRALQREIDWECGWRTNKNGQRLKDELTVIETLIASHRDEYDDLLETLRQRQQWQPQKGVRVRTGLKYG